MFKRLFLLGALFGFLISGTTAHAQSGEDPLLVFGRSDAPVEVIEIISMSCPTCRNFHKEGGLFDRFHASYMDKVAARWTIRDHYSARHELWVSMIIRCGSPEGRLERMKTLLDRQPELFESLEPNTFVQRLRKLSGEIGLSKEQTEACLSDAAYAKALVDKQEAFLAKYGLKDHPKFSTPLFIVNGQPVWNADGKVDYQKINELIFSEFRRMTGQ